MAQGGPASVASISRQLASRFPLYLSEQLVPAAQLTRLVRKALSRTEGAEEGSAGERATAAAATRGKAAAAAGSAYPYSSSDRTNTNSTSRSSTSSSSSTFPAQKHASVASRTRNSSSSGSSFSRSRDEDEYGMSHGEDEEVEEEPEHAHAQEQEQEQSVEDDIEIEAPEPEPEDEQEDDTLDGLYHPSSTPATEDLNTLSDAELARKKAEMNKAFEQNLLKPTDPGYVYDKQVDFQATEDSEWD